MPAEVGWIMRMHTCGPSQRVAIQIFHLPRLCAVYVPSSRGAIHSNVISNWNGFWKGAGLSNTSTFSILTKAISLFSKFQTQPLALPSEFRWVESAPLNFCWWPGSSWTACQILRLAAVCHQCRLNWKHLHTYFNMAILRLINNLTLTKF